MQTVKEKLKALWEYLKKLDDKEPIHTFYYLLGCGVLTIVMLSFSKSFMLANILNIIYFIVYFVFYIAYDKKGHNKKTIAYRALVLDVVISVLGLQILMIIS